jgi:5-methyltetrahydrofolate--homocysteine methyltransferase
VRAGLDLAIVNTEKLERYPSIPEEEKLLAENLLFNVGEDPIGAFAAHFRDQGDKPKAVAKAELPLDQRLAQYIIEGSKLGLIEDLTLKLEEARPLDIINGPLMDGMSEVGRLFNDNKLIVAEVLQSAEAMKAAVAFLEPFMEKTESSLRGSIILATVKGDVHDIGKNLVDIILSNNGYKVHNLGIKIPPEQIIQAVRTHKPDAIGLSGLLVKSAQQMVSTAADLKSAGIDIPLLVGGAALSRKFTNSRIAPEYNGLVVYAEDAMNGLDLLNQIMSPNQRPILEAKIQAQQADAPAAPMPKKSQETSQQRSTSIRLDIPKALPPDLERHVLHVDDLESVWDLINPQMLYVRHLGIKGRFEQLLEQEDPKAVELKERVDKVKQYCLAEKMEARTVWQFFPAEGRGNSIHIFGSDNGDTASAVLEFPRQAKPDGLCLSDLLLPPSDGTRDHLAMFVTTFGDSIRQRAEAWKDEGRYLDSHILQALALETAEATAEWIHRKLREAWGFPDPADLDHRALFRAEYRGKRYSFGYPACPDLEPQEILFDLLKPEDIRVELTDGFMMDPEGSVSAVVFHHPDAKYFST